MAMNTQQRVKLCLTQIGQNAQSYAILDLDQDFFCRGATDKASQAKEAADCLVDIFCDEEGDHKINAGILLLDLFRANVVPLTQDVSKFILQTFP